MIVCVAVFGYQFHIVHCSLDVVDEQVSRKETQGEVMAGTRVTLSGRLRRKLQKTLKRMKVKAIATKVEMNHVREETTQMVAAMEEIKLEIDLLKASVHHHCDGMLVITGAVDNLSEIIFQL